MSESSHPGSEGDPIGDALDHILIFGDPETRRKFLKRIAGTGAAYLPPKNFLKELKTFPGKEVAFCMEFSSFWANCI